MNIFSMDFEGCSRGAVATAVCQGLIECIKSNPAEVEKAKQHMEVTIKDLTSITSTIKREDVLWVTMSVLFESYRRETGLTIHMRSLEGGPVH